MKKILAILIVTFLLTFSLNAQVTIGIYSGFGQSSFDDDSFGEGAKIEQAGYIPAGLQIGFNLPKMSFGTIYLGAEVDYAVVPFAFAMNGEIDNVEQKVAELKVNQMLIGALVKIKFGQNNLNPFIRLGGGAYTGGLDFEYEEKVKQLYLQGTGETLEDEEIELKSAFGFNIGAGADFKIGTSSVLFGEFVYHMVSREVDEKGAESFGANNWAAHVGFQFGLN